MDKSIINNILSPSCKKKTTAYYISCMAAPGKYVGRLKKKIVHETLNDLHDY